MPQPRFRPPTRFVVRHAHVVVERLAGVAAVHRVQRADREARHVGRHDEHGDALVLGQIGIGAHGEPDVGGDVGERGPDLLAVDHPLVPHAHRARAQRGEVGARVRLAVADRERVFAAPDARQPAALLLLAAEVLDRRPDRGVGEVAVRHAPVLHLLDEQELVEQVAPLPALLHGPAHARPALLLERGAEARELGSARAVGGEVLGEQLGRAPLADERAQLGDERAVFGLPLEIHRRSPVGGGIVAECVAACPRASSCSPIIPTSRS